MRVTSDQDISDAVSASHLLDKSVENNKFGSKTRGRGKQEDTPPPHLAVAHKNIKKSFSHALFHFFGKNPVGFFFRVCRNTEFFPKKSKPFKWDAAG